MAEVELSIVQLATAVVGLIAAVAATIHFGPAAAEAASRMIWPKQPGTVDAGNPRGYRG